MDSGHSAKSEPGSASQYPQSSSVPSTPVPKFSFSLKPTPKAVVQRPNPFAQISTSSAEATSPPPASARPKPPSGIESLMQEMEAQKNRVPRGFTDNDDFRNKTRSVAQLHRDSRIIMRGSSVTGEGGNPSNPARFGKPFDATSDYDLAIISRSLYESDQVSKEERSRGFPAPNTDLQRTSNTFAQNIRNFRPFSKPSSVKVFSDQPLGEYIERPHTPLQERRDSEAAPPIVDSRERRRDRSRSPERDTHSDRDRNRDRSRSRSRDRGDSSRRSVARSGDGARQSSYSFRGGGGVSSGQKRSTSSEF